MDQEPLEILDQDTGNIFEMTCEEEPLPDFVPEEDDLYIDEDSIINYDDNQYMTHFISTITHDVSNIHLQRNKWVRLARQYLYILKHLQTTTVNPNILPVIRGKRIILEDDVSEAQDEGKHKIIQFDTYLSNRTTLFEAIHISDFVSKQSLWIQEENAETNYTIGYDTTSFLVHDEDIDENMMSKTYELKLLGPLQDFKGEKVEVIALYYKCHCTDDEPIVFNPNEYVKSLNEISVGNEVFVVCNQKGNIGRAKVSETTDTTIDIATEIGDISIDKKDITNNTVFIYKTNDNLYSKATVKEKNVVVLLCEGDAHPFPKTRALFEPSSQDLLEMYKEDLIKNVGVSNLEEFAALFEKYGFPKENNENPVQAEILARVSSKYKTHDASTRVRAPNFRTSYAPKHSILDLTHMKELVARFKYAPYGFPKRLCDDDYHRMKHLTLQGDNGLIFYTLLVKETISKLYHYIEEKSAAFKDEIKHIKLTLSSLESKITEHECKEDFMPDIKKTYDSLEKLEKDNYRTVSNIKAGDWAQLIEKGAQPKIYKRISTPDKHELWLFHRIMPYNQCNPEKEKILKHTETIPQKCVYDNSKQLCVSRKYFTEKNKIECLNERVVMLEKALDFHKNYGHISTSMTTALEWLSMMKDEANTYALHQKQMEYDDDVDYTNYVGDASYNDEDMYAAVEQGDNFAYAPMSTSVNEPTATTAVKGTYHDVAYLVGKFGVDIPEEDQHVIANTVDCHLGPEKIDVIKNKTEIHKTKKTGGADDPNTKQARMIWNAYRVFMISALYILFLQSGRAKNIERVVPHCRKHFSLKKDNEDIFEYCACVLRELAESYPNEEMLGNLSKISENNIKKYLKEYFNNVKKDNPNLVKKLEKLSEDEKAVKAVATYAEWESFKPYAKIGTTKNVSGVVASRMHALVGVVPTPKKLESQGITSTTMSTTKSSKASPGFVLSNPSLHPVVKDNEKEEEATIHMSKMKIVCISKEQHPVPTFVVNDQLLGNAYQNINRDDHNGDDDFWEEFEESTMNIYEELKSGVNIDTAIWEEFRTSVLMTSEEYLLKTRNSYRSFLFNNLKTILGKIANPQPPTDTHTLGAAITKFQEKYQNGLLKQSIKDIIQSYLIGESPTNSSNDNVLRRNIWIYNYILAMVFTKLIEHCQEGEETTKPLLDAIFAELVHHLENNSFIAKDIQHSQEKLREASKEAKIAGIEALSEEMKEAISKAKQYGIGLSSGSSVEPEQPEPEPEPKPKPNSEQNEDIAQESNEDQDS